MKKLGIIIGIICMIFWISFFLETPTKICTVIIRDKEWHIELVNTPEEREKGLMYRTDLCDTCGMLFIFDEQSPKGFWMKNTRIPIDMYFYDTLWKLVDKAQNMRPEKETGEPMEYISQPAQYVIEVAAGSQFFQSEVFNPTQCL